MPSTRPPGARAATPRPRSAEPVHQSVPPGDEHVRPPGVDDATVAAVGKVSEALETVDRATEEAKAGPFPEPGALETELWADGGSAWRS